METVAKKRIGTVEGVALILSVLACLILFVKIMPNINANMEFFTERLNELDREIGKLQLAIENLQRTNARTSQEAGAAELRALGGKLQSVSPLLPEEYRERLERIGEEIEKLAEELRR
jgi:prefoldin subunit 5